MKYQKLLVRKTHLEPLHQVKMVCTISCLAIVIGRTCETPSLKFIMNVNTAKELKCEDTSWSQYLSSDLSKALLRRTNHMVLTSMEWEESYLDMYLS